MNQGACEGGTVPDGLAAAIQRVDALVSRIAGVRQVVICPEPSAGPDCADSRSGIQGQVDDLHDALTRAEQGLTPVESALGCQPATRSSSSRSAAGWAFAFPSQAS